jgi:dTDP-4-dehydrorhamnose reductase
VNGPILVLGAGGQLGGAIVDHFRAALPREARIVPSTRAELDITDHDAVMARIHTLRPGAIVNCAAYTTVDEAERRPELALDVNAFAVRSIARAAADVQAVLVHYSTDFVFDGTERRPYTEDDPPNPRSVYAASKLLGEWFARDAPRHYVLRVESLFGGSNGRSSIDRIADALIEGREARVFTDRTISPSYALDVAWATRRVLELAPPSGVYHCVNDGAATWEEIGREAARVARAAGTIVPITSSELGLVAARPPYSALSTSKLRSVGIHMPPWRDALGRYLLDISCRRLRAD